MVRKFRKIPLYWSNRPGPTFREKWLQAFAGKLACGCVRAKSAIDVPMLSSQRLHDTTGPTFQISKTSDGVTASCDHPQNGSSDCFSNFSYTHWREVTKFGNVSSQN